MKLILKTKDLSFFFNKKSLLIVIMSFLIFQVSYSQTIKTVGSGGDYSTLTMAFNAINNGTLIGDIVLQIISSHTLTTTATLNASGTGSANYSSVLIYPTGSGYTISGSLNDNMINLNGADNVTFDGRVNQSGNADLTISNASTGNLASTIRFINSAESNTIKYCNIKGSSLNNTGGVIVFATSTSGNGNDNNTITNNNITNANGNRPVNLIFSLGTAGRENNTNAIQNNLLYDFFNTSANSNAITII
ncbi:MAG TPA: hypothetical protein P5250_01660 [Bacteroidales bacterium]|nr:hypothetical protein [Bacteroidales bacterium]